MKILVATKTGQGKRRNDFSFCNEGEIVRFGLECDGESVDGGCGCRRSLSGMDTSKGTTTMKVIESHMTREDFTLKLLNAQKKDGWIQEPTTERNIQWVNQDASDLLRIASHFNVGDIIEKRGDKFQVRIV